MNLGKMLFKTHLVLFISFFLFFLSSVSVANGASYTITTDETWTLSQSPYVISGEMAVNPGVTLTIEPGVVVKFNHEGGLTVYGTLHVNGTPDQKIYFTSIADDEVGGDTNDDGSASFPQPKDWTHIEFAKWSSGTFTNAVVRYGGFSAPVLVTGIYNYCGTVSISHSEIAYNGDDGIVQDGGSMTISDSEIHHQGTGIIVSWGNISLFHNSIYDNTDFGVLNYTNTNVDLKNSWWGSSSGPFHPILNPNGQGNEVSDYVDFIPWLTSDPFQELQNQSPHVSGLGQFKSDGVTEISEGKITTEKLVVFKSTLSDPDNDQVKLQIEVKKFGQSFDGNNLLESDFIFSGSEAIITKSDFSDGTYKWRARAVDDKNGVSNWQEFGVLGNVDFEVKLVPLYTQVRSPYPSDDETRRWFDKPYAYATQDKLYWCGWQISGCGCAITSMVMLGQYYDIDTAIDRSNVDPGNINTWLTDNIGYAPNGNLRWNMVIDYLGFIDERTGKKMVRFDFNYKTDWNVPSNNPRIDNYVDSAKPIVAYSSRFGHYFVIDGKLGSTYTLKDPYWYNTKRLDQPKNLAEHIQGYNNYFDTANLFSYLETPKMVSSSMHLYLASPAELLVTDPLGRKLGRDPIRGIVYDKIPNSIYAPEGLIVSSDNIPDDVHESKVVYILTPADGKYNIKVIGTDTGSYTLSLLLYDENGNSKDISITGNIEINKIQEFELNYSSQTVQETNFYHLIDIDIKPGNYPNSINLKSKGVTPAAVLTNNFFDARDIVIKSVVFAVASPLRGNLEDVDKDGDLDLILHFDTPSLQLNPNDTEAILTGMLNDGTLIKGRDSVRIVGK